MGASAAATRDRPTGPDVSPTPTPWCDEHDLPMRAIRTADDRIVCWYIWWLEAIGGWADGKAFAYCRPGTRTVT